MVSSFEFHYQTKHLASKVISSEYSNYGLAQSEGHFKFFEIRDKVLVLKSHITFKMHYSLGKYFITFTKNLTHTT